MSTTNLEGFLYSLLPTTYRLRDIETDYTLKRYLGALEVGLSHQLQELKNILLLLDVENIDAKFLPFYAKAFGVEYDPSIPESFQRKYLANLVDIFKRKGTEEVIKFICRELSGMNVSVAEAHQGVFRTWGNNPHDEFLGKYLQPKTYELGNRTFYLPGGDRTKKGRIDVTLIPTSDKQEITKKEEEALRKYIANLMPPYVQLVFDVHNKDVYSDVTTLAVSELDEDKWSIIHTDTINLSVEYTDTKSTVHTNILEYNIPVSVVEQIFTNVQNIEAFTEELSNTVSELGFNERLGIVSTDTIAKVLTEGISSNKIKIQDKGVAIHTEVIEKLTSKIPSLLSEETIVINDIADVLVQTITKIQNNATIPTEIEESSIIAIPLEVSGGIINTGNISEEHEDKVTLLGE